MKKSLMKWGKQPVKSSGTSLFQEEKHSGDLEILGT